MTAQELKNSILQLAVQGQLVPQDKNDEPASELLKRIQAEKAQLIKEGKIKKEKALSPITEEELPFDIPESWEWIRIKELGELKNGYAFKSVEYKPTGIQIVRISDLGEDCIETKNAVYYEERNDLQGYLIPKNSFLICMTGSIGKMAWVKDSIKRYLNQRVGLFQPFPAINLSYLWLFFHTPYVINKWIEEKTSLNGNIKNSDITDLLCPIPPLAEQQRIVDKIEELLPLVEEYGKAETRLKELNADFPDMLRKSILQQAVQGKLTERNPEDEPASELLKRIQAEKAQLIKDGKLKKEKPLPPITEEEIPFDIPETWRWVRFNDITEVIGDGIHGTPIFDGKGEYYFVNGNNLIDGKIVFKENTQKVSKGEYELYKKPLNNNTVLLSINGTIGNIAYYNREPIILGKSACYIALLSAISKEYIRIILGTKLFLDYAVNKATKTTIANVSLKAMRMFPVPLPPLEEQKRIVARVEELLALCDQLK